MPLTCRQGTTHTAVTPLDLVKCRRQVDANLYKGNMDGWKKIYRGEGLRGVFTGWSPTFFGYSVQGAGKYGFYEYFKHLYSQLVGEETAAKYKTVLYLTASASAELLADVGLCPFEAVKVRMQTTIPPTFRGTFEGISYITAREGTAGYVLSHSLRQNGAHNLLVCTRVSIRCGVVKSPTP